MFLRPFGLYCSACFGSLFLSILCTCCSHFFWYCFISFAVFCTPVFFFPNTLILYLVMLFQVCVSKISSVLLLNTPTEKHAGLEASGGSPTTRLTLRRAGNLSRGHQDTRKILKTKKRTDTQYNKARFDGQRFGKLK